MRKTQKPALRSTEEKKPPDVLGKEQDRIMPESPARRYNTKVHGGRINSCNRSAL